MKASALCLQEATSAHRRPKKGTMSLDDAKAVRKMLQESLQLKRKDANKLFRAAFRAQSNDKESSNGQPAATFSQVGQPNLNTIESIDALMASCKRCR